MDASSEHPSLPVADLAIRLRRHSLIVSEPAKYPGWGVAYPSFRPGEVAIYPVLAKDMAISGRLAEIVRRRLGIATDKFWPEW